MKTIAIVGFGFCGKMSFVNLVKNCNEKIRILIFDKARDGLFNPAFAEFSSHYILNIPAIKMSAFCEQEKANDFCNFLIKYYPDLWLEIGENGFAPRYIYGQYIDQIVNSSLTEAQNKGIEFFFINQEVVQIVDENQLIITTKNNELHRVEKILLATSFKQSQLPFKLNSESFIENLWDNESFNFHKNKFTNETVCLIGSSLSAIDVMVGLKNKGFAGKIIAISRHGNLPKKFIKFDNPNFIKAEDAKNGVVFLCKKIRKFLESNPIFDLRQVVSSIRPITKTLWDNFDKKNKQAFLRLLPYWNIFRHCVPKESLEVIEEMMKKGRVTIKKGGVSNVSIINNKFIIQNKAEIFEADYLINCLGFELKANKYPLLSQMIKDNLLQEDVLMVRSINPKIKLLGGLNVGRYFECTAVPELRVNIAESVASIFS